MSQLPQSQLQSQSPSPSLSLSLDPYTMHEKSMEVLSLEARNQNLRDNIETLEIENANLKSETATLKEEIGGLIKKSEEITKKYNEQSTYLLSVEEKYESLNDEFDEAKNEKKDRDDKIWELEKQVESQKSELARAHDEFIKSQKENEQCKNKLTECLTKSRSEIKELKSNNTGLEFKYAECKNQVDRLEKSCKALRHYNEILSSNGAKKAQNKDEDQSNDNNTDEILSKDKRDGSPSEFEEKQGSQDSFDETISEDSSYEKLSPDEENFPAVGKGDENENETSNTSPRNFLNNTESCGNYFLNSHLSCHEKIEYIWPKEQTSMIEILRGVTHSLVCRWIDVEINFIQGFPVLVKAIFLIWTLLIRFVGQYLFPEWEVFGSWDLSPCNLHLFFTSLWIYSQLTKVLLKIHILLNGIGIYFGGKKCQINHELSCSNELTSDQEILCKSRRSSQSSMDEEEIKKINSPQNHSPKISDLNLLPCSGRSISSSSYSSTYDSRICKIRRLSDFEKLNSEFASTSEPFKGELSVTELLIKTVSLLFFAPVWTATIKKRGTTSLNTNFSLLPTCNTSSRRYVFLNLSKFFKRFSEMSANGIYGKPPFWLTMIEMFTHFCVYIVIYVTWLKVLHSSFPHYSYYAPTYGYNHLHGWAHQLHFSEKWASKIERFFFKIITMFGVQVKNFPMPG